MSRIARALVASLAVVLLAGCQPGGTATQFGKGSREEVVASYLAALGRSDAAAMKQLVHPTQVDVDADVAARIARDGGRPISSVAVSYRVLDGSSGVEATVVGSHDGGRPYREVLTIGTADRRWYLTLGRGPATIDPGRPPASVDSPVP